MARTKLKIGDVVIIDPENKLEVADRDDILGLVVGPGETTGTTKLYGMESIHSGARKTIICPTKYLYKIQDTKDYNIHVIRSYNRVKFSKSDLVHLDAISSILNTNDSISDTDKALLESMVGLLKSKITRAIVGEEELENFSMYWDNYLAFADPIEPISGEVKRDKNKPKSNDTRRPPERKRVVTPEPEIGSMRDPYYNICDDDNSDFYYNRFLQDAAKRHNTNVDDPAVRNYLLRIVYKSLQANLNAPKKFYDYFDKLDNIVNIVGVPVEIERLATEIFSQMTGKGTNNLMAAVNLFVMDPVVLIHELSAHNICIDDRLIEVLINCSYNNNFDVPELEPLKSIDLPSIVKKSKIERFIFEPFTRSWTKNEIKDKLKEALRCTHKGLVEAWKDRYGMDEIITDDSVLSFSPFNIATFVIGIGKDAYDNVDNYTEDCNTTEGDYYEIG